MEPVGEVPSQYGNRRRPHLLAGRSGFRALQSREIIYLLIRKPLRVPKRTIRHAPDSIAGQQRVGVRETDENEVSSGCGAARLLLLLLLLVDYNG